MSQAPAQATDRRTKSTANTAAPTAASAPQSTSVSNNFGVSGSCVLNQFRKERPNVVYMLLIAVQV